VPLHADSLLNVHVTLLQVSKSANYCCTTPANPTGLLLLCEVALGEMYCLKDAKYIKKLPAGKHSTKGLKVEIEFESNLKLSLKLDLKLDLAVDLE
jgi:hypothetical protein